MSNQENLHDAFTEYERRADAMSDELESGTGSANRTQKHPLGPMLLIAASVVLVLAIAGAVVYLARDTSDGGGQRVGAGPATSTLTSPSVARSSIPHSTSSSPGPGSTLPATATTSAPPAPSTQAGPSIPKNTKQMKAALRRVLGNDATFTVTQADGNFLAGVLTNSSNGHQGGFDIQADRTDPGSTAICEDADTSHCKITKSAGGGSLATGHEKTQGGGTLYLVDYVFPNGAEFLLHLSSLADPKGGGQTLGSKPPLSLKQVGQILESSRW